MDIAKLRKEAGLTQEQLAKKVKVSASTISSWETGKSEPDEKEEEKLRKIFNLDEIEEEKTSRLHLELKAIYLILIILVPAIYFMLELNNMHNDIIDAYNSGVNFIKYMTDSRDFFFRTDLIYYLLYIVFILTDYIYYKVNRKSPLMLALVIEIVFLIVNIGVIEVPAIILFALPVIIGIVQLCLLLKNKNEV